MKFELELFYDERLDDGITPDFDENDRDQDVYAGMSDEGFESAKAIAEQLKDIRYNPDHIPDYFDGDYDIFFRPYNHNHYFFEVFDIADNLVGYEVICRVSDLFSETEPDTYCKCFVDRREVRGFSRYRTACYLLNTIQRKIHDANVKAGKNPFVDSLTVEEKRLIATASCHH